MKKIIRKKKKSELFFFSNFWMNFFGLNEKKLKNCFALQFYNCKFSIRQALPPPI